MEITNTSLAPEFTLKILDACPMGILITDQDEKILWSNSTLTTWINATKDEHVGSMLSSFLQKEFHVADDKPNFLSILDDKNDPARWLQHTTLQMDFTGSTYNVVFLADVNDQVGLISRLEQLETIEPVSGLLNRRAMLQNLEPLVSRSRRYENPLSIIAIEILNLNDIKAELGQDAVDSSILEISRLLKDHLRWADIISRIDDTNIVIILPETEKEDATNLAKKICGQIAELNINYSDKANIRFSACYGVTAWEKGNDSHILLKNGGEALSEAKSQGAGSIVTN